MQILSASAPCRRFGIWLILALGFSAVAPFAQAERNPVHSVLRVEPEDTARVIVKFRRDSWLLRDHALPGRASASETRDKVSARANALGARLGMSLGAGRAITTHAQVVTASGLSGAALAERLATEADVEYAVVDQRRTHYMVPDDPLYLKGPAVNGSTGGAIVGQWYLRAPAGEVAASINATGAWDMSTGSSSVVVAVLDTGVRPEHPDLAGRLLAGYDMIEDMATANDGDGRDADSSDPGDWVTSTESGSRSSHFYRCSAEKSSWHGTMTASIIGAASNDGAGMAGVASGVKLLPVRVLGKCGGHDSDIIAGMQWAAGLPVPGVPDNPNPARVINMSLGGTGACAQGYVDAIDAIGSQRNAAVIVAAAGNSNGQAVGVPANCPGVIAVSGLRHIGTKVGFSDLGPEIGISAPGGNCVNTDPALPCLYPILAATDTGATTPASPSYTDSFNTSLGTSFSAPLVAGTIALMLSAQPTLTLADVKVALQSSARAFPFRGAADDRQTGPIQICHAPNGIDQLQCYCTTSTCGAGILDAASAVAAALGLQPRIGVTPVALYPGEVATLSSAGSLVGHGRSVVSVRWSIVDGGGVVSSFSGGATAALATLIPSAAGRFSVRLTVTDDQGLTASAENVLSVAPGVTLIQGWNLIGNGSSTTLDVATTLGDATKVGTIWKWINSGNATDITYPAWAFYTPAQNDGGYAYAATKGYDFLTTINPGEGFWVNAKTAFSVPLPAGAAIKSSSFRPAAAAQGSAQALPPGWSLIAVGDSPAPSGFNRALSLTQPLAADVPLNLNTLWAWDALQANWYFYAPELDKNGGLALYIAGRNYLDFATMPTSPAGTLSPTTGFWVNMP